MSTGLRVRLALAGFLCLAVGASCFLTRGTDEREACDAACIALGRATKHAREDRDTARAVAVALEHRYATKREQASAAVAAVSKATTCKDSNSALVVAVAKQDTALTTADSAMRAHDAERTADDALVFALTNERDAWRARALVQPPRLAVYVAGLYDPLAQIPAASLDGEFRITANLSAIARVEQRFAPGERPRVYVGGRVKV